MSARRFRRVAAALALSCAAMPAVASDNAFTGSDVLTWSREGQESFFRTSVDMVGMVAAQIGPRKANCIRDWYYGAASDPSAANDLIRQVLARFPDHHPQATLLAVIERECGKMTP